MAHRRLDIAIAAALLAFAAALWWWLIPTFAGSGDQVILPRLVAVVVGALAAVMLVGTLGTGGGAGAADDDPFLEYGGGESGSILALVALWGVFCFTVSTVGFYLGGGVALIASYLLLGVRPLWAAALWTICSLLGVYLVFEVAFQLIIRPGTLERLLLDFL